MTIPRHIRASLQRNWKALNATVGIIVDILVQCLAFAAAAFLYQELKKGSQLNSSHFELLAVLIPLYLMTFTVLGIYRRIAYRSFASQLRSAARGHLYLSVILFSTIHFIPQLIPRPGLYATFILVAPFVYVATWLAVRNAIGFLRRFRLGRFNIIAIGSDPDFKELVDRLTENTGLRYNLIGTLRTTKSAERSRSDHIDVKTIETFLNENEVDQIVFSSSYQLNGSFEAVHALCRSRGVAMRIMSPESDELFSKVGLRDIAGIPVYVPEGLKIRRVKWIMKRAFDILVSSLLLVLLSPFFLLVAIAIKLESRGPVFFRQPRSLGAGDAPFLFLKFRSMRDDAETEKETLTHQNESDGALFKIKDDPRLTRVGKVIRKFSIDELPQLVNVLRGDMSLVGPRPLPVKDYTRIDRGDHVGGYVYLRSKVKPGMTGLWQVSGRSHLGFRDMVMLDLYYIENQTILFDLEILAQTVPVVLFGRGAY